MENAIQKLTDLVVSKYYADYKRELIPLIIEFVDDVYKRRLELADTDLQKNDVTSNRGFIESLNGTLVLPKSKEGTYYILISNEILKNNIQFISTICHEMTHIFDFIDFATDFGEGNFIKAEQHTLFKVFYYWTEFHARRIGYINYRDYLFSFSNDEYTKEELVNHIIDNELPLHYNHLLKSLQEYSYDNNGVKYIYEIIQFMGRFSVWEELFPDDIKADLYLPDYIIKAYGDKIIYLYNVLCSMKYYDKAVLELNTLYDAIEALSV